VKGLRREELASLAGASVDYLLLAAWARRDPAAV
jgi:hypothetical protein